jgi:glycosyltransferase 2 family protein
MTVMEKVGAGKHPGPLGCPAVDTDSPPAPSPPAGAGGRSRWLTLAVLAVVAGFFVATLAARWNDVISVNWRLRPGVFALACVLLAVSYALVACLWGLALRRAAGTRLVAGARIWFLSNLARYVPGNVWSYVGAVELARREGVARPTTLAVMALTQVLSVAVALLAGLPVLVAERARLGRPALLGAVVVVAVAGLAALFRRRLLGLARRRLPGFDPAGLTPSARTVVALVLGYAAYWAVTGLAFAALVASLASLAAADVPLVVAAYAAAYAAGFLALLTPAGLGVREGVLVVALAPVLPAGPALVVALVSRVWMMLAELAGAAVAHLAARRGTHPAARGGTDPAARGGTDPAARGGTEDPDAGSPGGGG